MLKNNKISIIGAGSWGTAIASVLADKGFEVYLWGHRQSHVNKLITDRKNRKFLPGYDFSDNIRPTTSLAECAAGCSLFCMVVPSQGYRRVFEELLNYIEDDCMVVSASKGVENETLKTMTQVMEDCIEKSGFTKNIDLAVLSGPSFAAEVAEKNPTAIIIGCKDLDKARFLQKIFVHDYFRVYASDDVVGLEICGALKNIVAIAAGICDGLGYGLNTRAALITRGLTEITRLGEKLGADTSSFYGLSGMGDLFLTCTGHLSRNRTVGLKLGQGMVLQDILDEMDMVAEGVKTTKSVYQFVQKLQLDMPILEQVYKILYEDKDCSQAVKDLLTRELKTE